MKVKLGCAAIAALVISTPASAASLLFNLTGSRSASFVIDTSSPTAVNPIQVQFFNVPGTFGGINSTAQINFQPTGFEVVSPNLNFSQFLSDRPLFTGPTSSPTFQTGTFQLRSIVSGESFLMVVALMPAAVPEPATWAMMIGGFGMVGGAMRSARRKRKITVRYA